MAEALTTLSKIFSHRSEACALVCGEQKLTYRQLYCNALNLSKWFADHNLSCRDTITIELDNSISFALVYLACAIMGVRAVPVNPLIPEQQKDYISKNARPQLIINKETQLPPLANDFSSDNDFRFAPEAELIFFTSGTTAQPKGVVHSFSKMVANVLAFNQLTDLDETTIMMNVMPMSYMAGFLNALLSPLAAGGTVLLAPAFSAATARFFWLVAMENTINTVWLSPTMAALLTQLNRSQEIPEWTSKHLQKVFVGTAHLPAETKLAFEHVFNAACYESYGMTETLLISCQLANKSHSKGSTGKLLTDTEVRTMTEEKQNISNTVEGELWFKSPYLLEEYTIGEKGERFSPLQYGWFPSGDIGYVDDSNQLFITGRTKDLIIHGGLNVSPQAVEKILLSSPIVDDAAVIGFPHPFWGEEIVAFIMNRKKVIILQELMQYCDAKLPPDAIPNRIIQIDDFPRTQTGKVMKNKLRDLL